MDARDALGRGQPWTIGLRRGAIYNGLAMHLAGITAPSDAARFSIVAVGEGPRPLVVPPLDRHGVDVSGRERSHILMQSIALYARVGSARDGIRCIDDLGQDISFVDVVVHGFRNGANVRGASRVSFVGCAFLNQFAGDRSHGVFAHGVDRLLIADCLFYRCGVDPITGLGSLQSHGVYTKAGYDPLQDPPSTISQGRLIAPTFVGNVFLECSSFAMTASADWALPGGSIINPVFAGNVVARMPKGIVHGAPADGGAYGRWQTVNSVISWNYFEVGLDIDGNRASWGVVLEGVDGATLEENTFAPLPGAPNPRALQIRRDTRAVVGDIPLLGPPRTFDDFEALVGPFPELFVSGRAPSAFVIQAWLKGMI